MERLQGVLVGGKALRNSTPPDRCLFTVARRSHAQLACKAPQRPVFQYPQAQDRGLVHRGGEGVEIGACAWAGCIKALMTQRMNAFLVLAARHPHQAAVIAQVVLQGFLDTRLEERGRMKSSLEAGSSADELKAGHLAGIIELGQIGETPLKAGGPGHRPKAGTP